MNIEPFEYSDAMAVMKILVESSPDLLKGSSRDAEGGAALSAFAWGFITDYVQKRRTNMKSSR